MGIFQMINLTGFSLVGNRIFTSFTVCNRVSAASMTRRKMVC